MLLSISSTRSDIILSHDLPFLKACWSFESGEAFKEVVSKCHKTTLSRVLKKKDIREIGRKDLTFE